MPARPYILAETTWRAVRDGGFADGPGGVAVLPWGATEAHNFHLPYGTDVIQVDAIAAEAGRLAHEAGARVMVLPAVPLGVQSGQLDIPFCLPMSPSTQLAVLRDLAAGLAGQGVRKLVILNGHGGNEFRALVRELQGAGGAVGGLFVGVVNWYSVVDARAFFDEPGDHAGELETSLMMHVAPGLVRPLAEAGDGREAKMRPAALREGWAWAPRAWTRASADTGVGNPARATPEKGRRYFEAVTTKIAGFLVELAGIDPGDMYDSFAPPAPAR